VEGGDLLLRKTLLVLSLLIILILSMAGGARADSLGFLGFTLGDSGNTCAAHLYQLAKSGQIENYQVINQNQIAAYLEIGGSSATLILNFSYGYLTSLLVASYTSSNLTRVVQHIIDEYPKFVNTFGDPTSFNWNIDNYMVKTHQFTNIAIWEFDDGEEIFIGVYNNNQTYSMYMVMQVTAGNESAS
jgi:hypothetical protein